MSSLRLRLRFQGLFVSSSHSRRFPGWPGLPGGVVTAPPANNQTTTIASLPPAFGPVVEVALAFVASITLSRGQSGPGGSASARRTLLLMQWPRLLRRGQKTWRRPACLNCAWAHIPSAAGSVPFCPNRNFCVAARAARPTTERPVRVDESPGCPLPDQGPSCRSWPGGSRFVGTDGSLATVGAVAILRGMSRPFGRGSSTTVVGHRRSHIAIAGMAITRRTSTPAPTDPPPSRRCRSQSTRLRLRGRSRRRFGRHWYAVGIHKTRRRRGSLVAAELPAVIGHFEATFGIAAGVVRAGVRQACRRRWAVGPPLRTPQLPLPSLLRHIRFVAGDAMPLAGGAGVHAIVGCCGAIRGLGRVSAWRRLR
jgi:hypothetical protein